MKGYSRLVSSCCIASPFPAKSYMSKRVLSTFLILVLASSTVFSFTFRNINLHRHDGKLQVVEACRIGVSKRSSNVRRHLFGFGGESDRKSKTWKPSEWSDSAEKDVLRQGATGATANMMENFKKTQQLGKKTAALVEELASTTVIGMGIERSIRLHLRLWFVAEHSSLTWPPAFVYHLFLHTNEFRKWSWG